MQQRALDIGDGANTYFIYKESAIEMARLIHQTQSVIRVQGEIYPAELDEIQAISRILDVACGPGAWAIEAARTHPEREVVGFDISPHMIEHGRMFAEAEGVANVSFCEMDALQPLAFPDGSFDLVNANYLQSFMVPKAWPPFLQECMRVLRPGGIVKICELEFGITNSPAAEGLYALWARMMMRAGRSFSCDGRHLGTTPALRPLLRTAGFVQIGHKPYAIECSYGSGFHQGFLEDMLMLSRNMQPFVRKVGGEEALSHNQEMLKRVVEEVNAEDFIGMSYLLTAWGVKPARRHGVEAAWGEASLEKGSN